MPRREQLDLGVRHVDRELSDRAAAAGIRWNLTYPGANGRSQYYAAIYHHNLRNFFETLEGAVVWLELELRRILEENGGADPS
jgi:hypothetical protein